MDQVILRSQRIWENIMPELPEVQTMVDGLNTAGILGLTIDGVAVHWRATIATPDVRQFCRTLKGRRFTSFSRRGKFILASLDDNRVMAVHLRMSGRFVLATPQDQRSRHIQVTFRFEDGRRLWFHDTRKFGRICLARDVQMICGHLGVEPLSPQFSGAVLSGLLAKSRRQLKPLLLDQTVIAGLGNIYADEALYLAGIHPLRQSHTLSELEVKRLHRSIRRVLRQGLDNAGTSLGRGKNNFVSIGNRPGNNASNLHVYRQTGQPCRKCGASIERIIVGQRSTHICRSCQRYP